MTEPQENQKQDTDKHPPKARYVWQRLWFQ